MYAYYVLRNVQLRHAYLELSLCTDIAHPCARFNEYRSAMSCAYVVVTFELTITHRQRAARPAGRGFPLTARWGVLG